MLRAKLKLSCFLNCNGMEKVFFLENFLVRSVFWRADDGGEDFLGEPQWSSAPRRGGSLNGMADSRVEAPQKLA